MSNVPQAPAAPAAPPAPPVDLSKFGVGTPRAAKPAALTAERRDSILTQARADMGKPPPSAVAPTPPAEVAPPTETPTEAPPEAAPAPDDSPLARAQKVAAAARAAGAKHRERTLQRARMEREAGQAQAEAAQLRTALQQVNGRLDSLRSDPLRTLRELGVPPEEITRQAVQAGTPEEKIVQIEAARQRDRAELEQLKRRIQSEEYKANMRAEEARFMRQAGNGALYPNLTGEPPQVILAYAKEIAAVGRAKGKIFSNEEILGYIDHRYGKHKARTQAGQGGSGDGARAGAATKQPASRTVSNADQTAMNSRPPKLHDLKPADMKAELLRRARADVAAAAARSKRSG